MNYALAKRGPDKVKKDYTLKHIFKEYKKEHKNDGFAVDEETYRKVILYFNKRIMQLMLEGSRTFDIPYRLGSIRVRKKKMNISSGKKKIDFGLSRKYGKTIYHLNDHTDNYYYRFYWNKARCNAKNVSAYFFKAGRQNERRLCFLVKNKKTDYFL